MEKICRRRDDGTILYTVEGVVITIYDRKGRYIISSNEQCTIFYSGKGKAWKIVKKTQNGYHIEKKCGGQWYAIDLTNIGDGPFDYNVTYTEGYKPFNWWCSDVELIDECKEAFSITSLISYGKNPKEIWTRNKKRATDPLYEYNSSNTDLESQVVDAIKKNDPDILLSISWGQYLSSREDLIKYSYRFTPHADRIAALASKYKLNFNHNYCGQSRIYTRCWLEFRD